MTIEYGLIGENLSHSFSKEVHEYLADYDYELLALAPDQLDAFMKEKSFRGINVTIPYKEAVIPYLDVIDDTAKAIGAVNTVVNKGGKLYGYNTDILGMESLIRLLYVDLKDKKVAILGSGGTSLTATALAKSYPAREIIHVSRSPKEGAISYEDLSANHKDLQILINTTPVGMYPKSFGVSPVDLDHFPELVGIVDVVYNPLRTQLVLEGQKREIPSFGGLFMLIFQAYYACELFLDRKLDLRRGLKASHKILRSKENIVLIGMPSSGKTSVGKALAKRLNRPFYDSDELIVARQGREIKEIFHDQGEASFRQMEADLIQELKTLNGAVIATGGGTILRQENVDALKANGHVFFLDRPLKDLTPTDTRPLSSNREDLEKKYEERYLLYLASSDSQLLAEGSIDELVDRISEEYQ